MAVKYFINLFSHHPSNNWKGFTLRWCVQETWPFPFILVSLSFWRRQMFLEVWFFLRYRNTHWRQILSSQLSEIPSLKQLYCFLVCYLLRNNLSSLWNSGNRICGCFLIQEGELDFSFDFKPHQKKIASKFKLELEKTLGLWDGRGCGGEHWWLWQRFVGTKFELFVTVIWLINFFCL